MAAVRGAESMRDEAAPNDLLRLMAGKWASQAIYVAAELGIADLLKDGPRSTGEIAQTLGVREDAVFRLLRALAGLGLFSSQPDRRFALTPSGNYLRADWPGSLHGWARLLGHEALWRPTGELGYSVRTGKPAFSHVFGMAVFDYLSANPEIAAIFHDAMTSMSATDAASVIKAYDFSGIHTLVDVGGGHGFLLATILKAHVRMRGILFEQPHAIRGAAALLQRQDVGDRCALVDGDFFVSVPAGGDAYILKSIIHDWEDDRAVQILRNCHRAMPASSKLLLVERLLLPGDEPDPGKFVDLEMLTMTDGGRERTEAEFEGLLARAGFKLTRVVEATPKFVIEAVRL